MSVRALEYLHEHNNPPVVHRDLKCSNVLLDSNFNAKVRLWLVKLTCQLVNYIIYFPLLSFVIQLSDFGFAVVSGMQHKNIKMSGTLGYVAPEYISHGIQEYLWS